MWKYYIFLSLFCGGIVCVPYSHRSGADDREWIQREGRRMQTTPIKHITLISGCGIAHGYSEFVPRESFLS